MCFVSDVVEADVSEESAERDDLRRVCSSASFEAADLACCRFDARIG